MPEVVGCCSSVTPPEFRVLSLCLLCCLEHQLPPRPGSRHHHDHSSCSGGKTQFMPFVLTTLRPGKPFHPQQCPHVDGQSYGHRHHVFAASCKCGYVIFTSLERRVALLEAIEPQANLSSHLFGPNYSRRDVICLRSNGSYPKARIKF